MKLGSLTAGDKRTHDRMHEALTSLMKALDPKCDRLVAAHEQIVELWNAYYDTRDTAHEEGTYL